MMLYRHLCSIAMTALASSLNAYPFQTQDYVADRTTGKARAEFAETQLNEKVIGRLSIPLSEENEGDWGSAFWTAALLNYHGPVVRAAVEESLRQLPERSDSFHQTALRSVYTLFPNDYAEEVNATLPHLTESRPFATAAAYLLNHDNSAERRLQLLRLMIEKFPDWKNDGRLQWLWHRFSEESIPPRPELSDLLTHDFGGKAVIFSFQRQDRRWPGVAVVRGANGEFVTDSDGNVEMIQQLAMSRTNMPGTITFGNSPQGLYVVNETGIAKNVFIGPTPYLYSKVPYEASVGEYLYNDNLHSVEWSHSIYTSLLPESWASYWPFQEAWWAGVAGRDEMLTHGTTINPDFYQGESYYPNTPSAGCLCTFEQWDPETGRLQNSNQVRLLNAFHGSGDGTGYLVLVEVDDQKKELSMEEVANFLTLTNQ